MSLAKDITEIKKLVEDKPVFKAAGPEEIAARKEAMGPAWYSIRVVRANNEEQALEEILDENFDEEHPLCDRIIPAKDCVITDKRFSETITEAKPVFKAATPKQVASRPVPPRLPITLDDVLYWSGDQGTKFLAEAIKDIANGDYTIEELRSDLEDCRA